MNPVTPITVHKMALHSHLTDAAFFSLTVVIEKTPSHIHGTSRYNFFRNNQHSHIRNCSKQLLQPMHEVKFVKYVKFVGSLK